MEVTKYECTRCGHVWIPKKEIVKCCPNCNSPYWNKPRHLKGDGRKMTTLKISEMAYKKLLSFKNFHTMKLRGITNNEVFKRMGTTPEYIGEVDTELLWKLANELDFEPEYTFTMLIVDTIDSVMNEQETGEVNYIT